MTTYADDYNLRNPAVLNGNGIASAIDGMLITYQQIEGVTLRNTTSVTFTDITSVSVSVTVTARAAVDLVATASFSHGTILGAIAMRVARNGAAVSNPVQGTAFRGDVNGTDFMLTACVVDKPGAGNWTYTIQWVVSGGTGYSTYQQLRALVIQNG